MAGMPSGSLCFLGLELSDINLLDVEGIAVCRYGDQRAADASAGMIIVCAGLDAVGITDTVFSHNGDLAFMAMTHEHTVDGGCKEFCRARLLESAARHAFVFITAVTGVCRCDCGLRVAFLAGIG